MIMSIWRYKLSLKLGEFIDINIVYGDNYGWGEDVVFGLVFFEICYLRGCYFFYRRYKIWYLYILFIYV